MSKIRADQRCQRPECQKKGTVTISKNGRRLVVCQRDVNWAYQLVTQKPQAGLGLRDEEDKDVNEGSAEPV